MKRFRIQGLPAKLVLSLLHGLSGGFLFVVFCLAISIWMELRSGHDIDWWDLICERINWIWCQHRGDVLLSCGCMALGALLGILFQLPPRLKITFNVLFLSLLTAGVDLAMIIGLSMCVELSGLRNVLPYIKSDWSLLFFMGFFSLISYGVCYRLALSTGFLKRVYPAGCCEHCGYDLRATLGATCPECGQALPPVTSDHSTSEK